MRPETQRLLKQADRDLDSQPPGGREVPEGRLGYHGDSLGVPADLRRHLTDLTSDYTVSQYPDAANAVPYELYDEVTARTKVENADAVIAWLRRTIAS